MGRRNHMMLLRNACQGIDRARCPGVSREVGAGPDHQRRKPPWGYRRVFTCANPIPKMLAWPIAEQAAFGCPRF